MKSIMIAGCALLALATADGAWAASNTTKGAVAGAVGGAVVAGPVGLVVGGVGGAVAGRHWRGRGHYRHVRHSRHRVR